MKIDQIYEEHCSVWSDICAYLPLLKLLANGRSVLELGVRDGFSTAALLAGRPSKLLSIDINPFMFEDRYDEAAREAEIDWEFHQTDSRQSFGAFDLVFIDTLHTYGQLIEELSFHSAHARKILIHDIVLYGWKGEQGVDTGLWNAVVNFLDHHRDWRIESHYVTDYGMLVLTSEQESLPT